ncbi:hypothetical protein KKJ06_17730 [Xenorhabdus bovienii]|uniref:hypothetical protein n=2 Tax=Xenorhabdus bovienii TaxID=40576 RepID=UPI0023B2ED99|nr:hypothetical protein [Xenorhabdus bovienii]MDE9428223.1 hypothetical protein [Xenorhabdus bovienii]MDE9493728.1 hypothetical protein [Xenorhabdus bovienii]MDE9502265.1 hypothetical protein [Xenorhabdus bovienii]MDE9526074.1 hypothetical protein [Xenorhabdus bovienii]MDE9557208.1 hypothetical protein [Xenorhabdus bovienii]
MINDDELYSEISRILYEAAPDDAQTILLDAELSPGNDHVKFLYDYIDESGCKKWYLSPSPKTDRELIENLAMLRKYYVENNLTNDHSSWSGWLVTVDLNKMKINIEFKYED